MTYEEATRSAVEIVPGVKYNAQWLPPTLAASALAALVSETPWTQPEINMFGKRVRVPRLTAWHGDTEASYRYSGVTNRPAVWTPLLSDLRAEVEQQTGARFNSVLLNYYRDGSDHVSWHADDEPELGAQPTIASVSLGSERRFALRTIATPRHTVGLTLNSGSLLVMSGATQEEWQHCVRKETRAVGPRVNLTFRLVS